MNKAFSLLFSLFFFLIIQANSQNLNSQQSQSDMSEYPYWIEMMQDQEANFFDVQKAFNIYWQGREVTKGSGWKPFKRWEYLMESRVNVDGSRPDPDNTWQEYFSYLESHSNTRDNNGNWVNLGPFQIPDGKGYKGLGRINAIGFHPTDPGIFYIGAPAGGLWKTEDNGLTWTSNTDVLPTLGVSSILTNFLEPDIMYIGTGDRDAGDAPGLGVMKSDDGGETWALSNNGMGNKKVGRMIMHPDDPDMIIAATSSGVFKTIDGGENWYKPMGGNIKEIVFKTDDPSTIFASGGGNFYYSDDTGENWIQITSGLPGSSRGVIGVTPANPEYVYFLITTSSSYKGIYQSVDGGLNFTLMSNSPNIMSWGCNGGSGGQAWYDLDIAVDPLDENTIFAGGVNCFKSIDGGVTWDISSHWWGDCGVPSVHADLHVLEYNPLDGKLYAGNDGGIYWTDNGGEGWHEISNGLAIGQVYKIGQSATVKDLVINGYQDNGTSTYLGTNWKVVYGGDGMECAIDHKDSQYSYATVYYGSIFRIVNNNGSHQIAGDGIGGINESGAWVTPFILDQGNSDYMYVGYYNVWRCKNVKIFNPTWEKISSGEGSQAKVLEQSPANGKILYVVRNSSTLKRTDNLFSISPDWIDLTSFLPNSGTPTDIEAHPFDPEIVYMTLSNHVYKSFDKGMTWTDISGTLPNIHFSSLACYNNSPEGVYLGTDAGIYYRDQSMDDWILYSDGFPVAGRVTEIEIYYDSANISDDMIRASTYGRGLWESEPYYGMPEADFTVNQTLITPGCPVNFTDLSTGIPHQWEWTFEGGTPESSTEKNPQDIIYENAGIFEVKLVANNPSGTNSIIKAGYITVSTELLPVADFEANKTSFCSGNPIVDFYDLSSHCPISWQWLFDPWSAIYLEGTNANSQNPVVQFFENTTYSVTLTVTNSNGENVTIKDDYIAVGGFPVPFIEDFETGTYATRSWTVDNPDGKKTWEIFAVGGSHQSDYASGVNMYNYIVPPGARDRLISPALDLTEFNSIFLSFEHAYAQKYPSVTDSLIVYVSDDCGETWTRIFSGGENGTGNFATHPLTTDEFLPQISEDWCGEGYGSDCNQLDISAWAGLKDIKIMFETYNYLGNNIFIDNVHITSPVGAIMIPTEESEINIYPNPVHGTLYITHNPLEGSLDISIYNLQGQLVFTETTENHGVNTITQLDIGDLPKGIYLIKLISGDFLFSEKLSIE